MNQQASERLRVGLSFGRCIRDIVEGKIDADEVLIVISRTRIENWDQVVGVIDAYLREPDYLAGLDRDACIETAYFLWNEGRIHQPRLYGFSPHRSPEDAVWMDVIPSGKLNDNPLVRDAWDAYRVAVAMAASDTSD
jgi:hypothetical protein